MADVPFNPFPTVNPDAGGLAVRSNRDFGGSIGQGLGNIGDSLIQAGKDQDALRLAHAGMTNELIANDQSTDLMKQVTQLYGEFSKREGRAAVEALPAFQAQLDQLSKSALGSLPNLDAKVQASRSFKYVTDTYYRYAQDYATTQFKTWQTKSSVSRANELGTQAVMAVNNPDKMEAFLTGSDNEIRKLGETKFMDDASITDAVKINRGSNVRSLVDSLLAGGDVNRAEGVFEKYQGQIDGDSQVAIQKVLKPQIIDRDAQSAADYALGRADVGAQGASGLLRVEEGFQPSAYWDVNHFRVGYGSDTYTTADGDVHSVTKDTVISKADAERDLSRRISEFVGDAATKVGAEAWNALPKTTRSALVSVAYNYGSLPGSVVAAIQTGDNEQIANAVEGLSANPGRRKREAAIIRSGSMPGGDPQADGMPERSIALQNLFDITQNDPAVRTRGMTYLNQEYTVASAAYSDQARQAAQVKAAQDAADDAAQKSYMGLMYSPTPPTAVQIAQDSRLKPESSRSLIGFLNAQDDTPTEVSRGTLSDLLGRMRLPEGNPNKITTLDPAMDAVIAGTMNKADYKFFQDQYTSSTTDEGQRFQQQLGQFFTGYQPIVQGVGTAGLPDPNGGPQFYQFQSFVNGQVAAYRAAGKNPFDLLDPTNPAYVGKPAIVQTFQSTMDQKARATLPKLPDSSGATQLPTSPVMPEPQAEVLRKAYKSSLINQGETEDSAEQKSKQLKDQWTAPKPFVQPPRSPNEDPETYLKRIGKQSMVLPTDEFNNLDLGSKLHLLDTAFG